MRRLIYVVVLLAWTVTGGRLWGQAPAPQPSEKEVLSRALERGLAREQQGLVPEFLPDLSQGEGPVSIHAHPADVPLERIRAGCGGASAVEPGHLPAREPPSTLTG